MTSGVAFAILDAPAPALDQPIQIALTACLMQFTSTGCVSALQVGTRCKIVAYTVQNVAQLVNAVMEYNLAIALSASKMRHGRRLEYASVTQNGRPNRTAQCSTRNHAS